MEPRNEDINAKKIISVEDAITKLGKARLEVFRPARIRTVTSAPEWGGGGVLLGILGGDVPPGSQNPDPISEQKMSFSRPVFRPGL